MKRKTLITKERRINHERVLLSAARFAENTPSRKLDVVIQKDMEFEKKNNPDAQFKIIDCGKTKILKMMIEGEASQYFIYRVEVKKMGYCFPS